MKLLIASDVHGSRSATKKAIEVFKAEQADYLILLGDIMYHGPRNPLPDEYNPAGVSELFNDIKDRMIAVRGNCDSEVDQALLEFPIGAEYQTIPFSSGKLFATHGHIFDPDNMPTSLVKGDVFAFGHVHLPILEISEIGILILNPGSASLPKKGHPPTYAIMNETKIQIKTFDGEVYMERRMGQ